MYPSPPQAGGSLNPEWITCPIVPADGMSNAYLQGHNDPTDRIPCGQQTGLPFPGEERGAVDISMNTLYRVLIDVSFY